jgi:hypothetical protein
MPRFRVTLREKEIRYSTYEIDAPSLEQAIKFAEGGNGKVVKNEYWDTESAELIEAYDVEERKKEIPF